VPRHVARLVTRLVAPLVVDYSASRRLVVNYFAYAARPSASHVTRLVAWLVAPLVVDYFAYTMRPGASARRAARHAAHRRLLRAPRLCLAATLALLQPRRAS
jgi:hypothetical protein